MLEASREEGDNLTVQATLPGVVLEAVATRTTLVVPGAIKEAFTVVVVPGAMKEAFMVVVPDVPHPHTKAEQPSRCPEYVDKKRL